MQAHNQIVLRHQLNLQTSLPAVVLHNHDEDQARLGHNLHRCLLHSNYLAAGFAAGVAAAGAASTLTGALFAGWATTFFSAFFSSFLAGADAALAGAGATTAVGATGATLAGSAANADAAIRETISADAIFIKYLLSLFIHTLLSVYIYNAIAYIKVDTIRTT